MARQKKSETEPIAFAKVLKAVMRERALTLKQIGEMADVAPSVVSDLTAGTKPQNLKAVGRFAVFHPTAAIFTRLDETDSLAALFCEIVRNKMPVSYLCDGQIVPEDIKLATRDRITEGLVRRLPGVLQSAAA